MNKKIILALLISGSLFAQETTADLQKENADLRARIAWLEKALDITSLKLQGIMAFFNADEQLRAMKQQEPKSPKPVQPAAIPK